MRTSTIKAMKKPHEMSYQADYMLITEECLLILLFLGFFNSRASNCHSRCKIDFVLWFYSLALCFMLLKTPISFFPFMYLNPSCWCYCFKDQCRHHSILSFPILFWCFAHSLSFSHFCFVSFFFFLYMFLLFCFLHYQLLFSSTL